MNFLVAFATVSVAISSPVIINLQFIVYDNRNIDSSRRLEKEDEVFFLNVEVL